MIYKRNVLNEEFCGLDNEITSEELEENEAGIIQDDISVGQNLLKESELVVSLYYTG